MDDQVNLLHFTLIKLYDYIVMYLLRTNIPSGI